MKTCKYNKNKKLVNETKLNYKHWTLTQTLNLINFSIYSAENSEFAGDIFQSKEKKNETRLNEEKPQKVLKGNDGVHKIGKVWNNLWALEKKTHSEKNW